MKRLLTLFLMTLVIIVANAYNTIDLNITSGGKNRHMILKVPANFEKNRPMLICCHGASQSAAYMTDPKGNFANFEAIVDAEQFLAVYPDGEGNMWDISGTKDTQFMIDIINEMKKRYSIDENRVYLSGFSMGGMFTYHAMNKLSDKIAAFAPLSGYPMNGPNAASPRPVPFIHVHGSGDDVCTFSPVQNHINAWVSHNKCVATPVQEKPKSGPANTSSYLNRYKAGAGGVEVALLVNPGKGHWVSNDPNYSLTYREVWDFVSRYSLTAGPKVLSVSPENDSFDMLPSRDRQFVFTLDKPVDCSKAALTMTDGTDYITFKVEEKGFCKTLTFNMDSNMKPHNSEYRMQLRNLVSEDSGTTSTVAFYYTYGVIETGDEMKVETFLSSDWISQKASIGEGIPVGWHRINTKSDGSDEKTSGMANTGGARMKYFVPGGDFDAGFYLSAREYEKCEFTYGKVDSYTLPLTRGRYILSFRSVYWDEGAKNNNLSFSANINKPDGSTVASATCQSSGCMFEKDDRKVTDSKLHEIEFEITSTVDHKYQLQYSMASGWASVIIGPPTLIRKPTPAEMYKGEFLRTLKKAEALAEELKDRADSAIQLEALNNTINKYKELVSILPSEYENARMELTEVMKPDYALGVENINVYSQKGNGIVYDLMGRQVKKLQKSTFYIKNGKKIFVK